MLYLLYMGSLSRMLLEGRSSERKCGLSYVLCPSPTRNVACCYWGLFQIHLGRMATLPRLSAGLRLPVIVTVIGRLYFLCVLFCLIIMSFRFPLIEGFCYFYTSLLKTMSSLKKMALLKVVFFLHSTCTTAR